MTNGALTIHQPPRDIFVPGTDNLDFARVYEQVARFMVVRNYRYAVIGGWGLSAYGFYRATLDLDFAAESRAQASTVDYLESLGYETLYRSSGYSNHLHPEHDLGRIDFVYVGGDTSQKLFTAIRHKEGPAGPMPVPRPEHLIALKVLAMKNAPERVQQELADIRLLYSLDGINQDEVLGYFEKHGLKKRFHEIEE